MEETSSSAPCPGCAWPFPPGSAASGACPRCGIPLHGPLLAQVRQADAELWRLGVRRDALLAHRGRLLAEMWKSPRPSTAPPGVPAGPAAAPVGAAGADARPRVAQNLLLVLGGLLLAVAALAFTLLAWGDLGMAGRAAVLAVLTGAAAAAPVALLRHGLRATAECVACLALLLLVLDAYALRQVALHDIGPWGYTGTASAVIAALWAGYGRAVGRGLRLPLPVAVCLAQLPLPLWAVAGGAETRGLAWALLGTAACDLLLVTHVAPSPRAVRVTGAVTALISGGTGLLLALGRSVDAEGAGEALDASLPLVAAAALAGYAALRHPRVASAAAVAAGLCLVAAAGGALRPALSSGQWWVMGYLLAGVALLAGTTVVSLPGRMAVGVRAAALAVHAGALLWVLPPAAHAVLGPLGWVERVWEGAPQGARAAVSPGTGWIGPAAAPAVLLVVCAVAAVSARAAGGTPWAGRLAGVAAGTGGVGLLVLPVACDVSYHVALGSWLLLAVALIVLAARVPRGLPDTPALRAAGLVAAGTVTSWSLAGRTETLVVLSVLLGALSWAAVRAGGGTRRGVPGCAVVLYTAGLAGAVTAALDVPAHLAAFALLAVAVAVQPVAAALGTDRAVGEPLEAAGALVAVVAVALTVPHAVALSSALGVAGVTAAGVALRPRRRVAARWVSAALLVGSAWVRLGSLDVTAPEAYTAPLSVAALLIGYLHTRQTDQVRSWAAYGPGLVATLLPSMIVAWGDPGWQRPLALGCGALAVTLVGARLRLQAPLLLGGGVLALIALHELAPYVAQMTDALPRWVPPALAGVLLLVVGATYEQRRRDARRLRDKLARLR